MVDLGQKKVNSRSPFFIILTSNYNLLKIEILTLLFQAI